MFSPVMAQPFIYMLLTIGLLIVVPIIGTVLTKNVDMRLYALCAIAPGFLVALYKKHGPTAQKYRVSAKFSVHPEGVTVAGRLIPRRDIHRVIIRNHILSEYDSSDTVYVAGAAAAAAMSYAKYQRRLAAISYRVDLEASGVARTLAGGLDETTAFALLSDVSRLLGLG
jgi:hypothetical protein